MSVWTPPGWYPDPFGRFEHRYWDGVGWTEHVGGGGRQYVDPPVAAPPPSVAGPAADSRRRPNKKVQREVRQAGVVAGRAGGGTLFTEPVLVVNQKAKMFELNAEYTVYDQCGLRIGFVREIGHTLMKKMFVPGDGRHSSHRLQVCDPQGTPWLLLVRPTSLIKSKVNVMHADGSHVGQIVQKTLGIWGGVRFSLQVGDTRIGSLEAESWSAWDFTMTDHGGNEVARISKQWIGFAKQTFTKADHYVVEMHRVLEDPLRSLVIAAALTIDTVLFQES